MASTSHEHGLPSWPCAQPPFPSGYRLHAAVRCWATRGAAEAGFDSANCRGRRTRAAEDCRRTAGPGAVILQHYSALSPGYRVLGPNGYARGRQRTRRARWLCRGAWGDVIVRRWFSSVARASWRPWPACIADVAHREPRTIASRRYVSGRISPATTTVRSPGATLLEQTSTGAASCGTARTGGPSTARRCRNGRVRRKLRRYRARIQRCAMNLLALSLLNVLREPLPRVLRERVMDPIGASSTGAGTVMKIRGRTRRRADAVGVWRWTFWRRLFIFDCRLARFGLLMEREGRWVRPLSCDPTGYGNDGPVAAGAGLRPALVAQYRPHTAMPAAPATAYWAADSAAIPSMWTRSTTLVVVLRWIPETVRGR